MANFNGYLLKAVATDEIFPLKYIQYDTWDAEPDHREEVKAYRNDYTRDLYRFTASGTKSSFAFTTTDNLKLRDREIIKAFFDRATVNAHERKVQLEYWNDEELQYKTGYFYIPNMNFKIKKIVNNNDLVYNSFKMEFVEY